MSRSTNVYVVCSKDRQPMATFTVKHECKTWLNKYNGLLAVSDIDPYWVCRFPDGSFVPTIPVFTIKEFLES